VSPAGGRRSEAASGQVYGAIRTRGVPGRTVWPEQGAAGATRKTASTGWTEIGLDRPCGHASNNLANILRDLAVTLPRERLRPAYGDGFQGAPWRPRTAGEDASGREREEPDDGSRTAHASDAGGPSDV